MEVSVKPDHNVKTPGGVALKKPFKRRYIGSLSAGNSTDERLLLQEPTWQTVTFYDVLFLHVLFRVRLVQLRNSVRQPFARILPLHEA